MAEVFHPYRQDFPFIDNRGDSLVYLDNAATTQKPKVVLDALRDFYESHNANVHRSAHSVSNEATALFERARQVVADFLGAGKPEEIVWTRGTTEAINLVAQCYAPLVLSAGSQVVTSHMEHHSNIVPWQLACERAGAELKPVRVTSNGELDLDHYRELLTENVQLVAVGHVSNALGTINPVEKIIKMAHQVGAKVLLDGAQAAAHVPIDVKELGCDFYAFSGHKTYGPTGIGALYGKLELLQDMPPWQGGGEMIEHVSFEKTTYQAPPYRFEAGTPDISGPIGLQAALIYLQQQMDRGLIEYEDRLLRHTTSHLSAIDGVKVIGPAIGKTKCPIVSFVMEDAHPADIATLLDEQGVAVRSGHHCAIPLMESLGIPGTVRASIGMYNRVKEIGRLVDAVKTARRILKA